MKILIVEDEIKQVNISAKVYRGRVRRITLDNGLTDTEPRHDIKAEYDLVILDIMLPDVNGWDIIPHAAHCRKGYAGLTADSPGTIEHRSKDWNWCGRSTNLAFAELLARVRTLLRRGNTMITKASLRWLTLD